MTDPMSRMIAQQEAEDAAERAKTAEKWQKTQTAQAQNAQRRKDNAAALQELANQFLAWAKRNGIPAPVHRIGFFSFKSGWIIGTDSWSSDSQTYSPMTQIYHLLLTPGGKLIPLIYQSQAWILNYIRSGKDITGFSVEDARATVATIVRDNPHAPWP